MPPVLALILCIIFVFYLLRVDRRQSPEVSLALWIPTIWILIIGSKPLGIWFNMGGANVEEGSELDRIVLIVLLCLGIIVLVKRKFYWSNALRENNFLMSIIVYMLLSLFWSNMPFVSFKRWSRELIVIVMAFAIASEQSPRRALESVLRRIVYVLIPLSYLLINYFGEYGRLYVHNQGILMWTGATLHKNTLGQLCFFSVLYLIWGFIRRLLGKDIAVVKYQTHIDVFLIFLSIWLMGGPHHNLSYSTTSTISLIIALSAIIILYRIRRQGYVAFSRGMIFMIAVIFGYGIITPMIGQLSIVDVASIFGRNESLTGRSEIWAVLVPMAMQKWLMGYGFGGFWTTEMRDLATVSQAHNGYLDLILELGFIGILLYGMFFMSCARKAIQLMAAEFDWGVFWICYLIIVAVHNIAESSMSSFSNFLMAIFIFQLVCLPNYQKLAMRRALDNKLKNVK
jgi:exopolysaccharide production protein ExoQ